MRTFDFEPVLFQVAESNSEAIFEIVGFLKANVLAISGFDPSSITQRKARN